MAWEEYYSDLAEEHENRKYRKMAQKKQKKYEIITDVGRLSFCHLIKPQGINDSDPKFSVTTLFPKKDKDGNDKPIMVKRIVNGKKVAISLNQAIKEVKANYFGPDEAKWPKMHKPDGILIKSGDGDAGKDKDGQPRDGYAGHYVVKATKHPTTGKPKLWSSDNTELKTDDEKSEIYSGCFGRVQGLLRVWNIPEGSKKYGVQLIVDHVQKHKDGTPFGGSQMAFDPHEAEDDEEETESEDEELDEEVEESDASEDEEAPAPKKKRSFK